MGQAVAAHASGDYSGALTLFAEAIEAAAEDDTAQRQRCVLGRAASLCAAGRFVEALEDCEAAQQREPEPEPEGDEGEPAAEEPQEKGHAVACACLRQLGRLSDASEQLSLAQAAAEPAAPREAAALQETEQLLAHAAQCVVQSRPAAALEALEQVVATRCMGAPEIAAALASTKLRLGDLDAATAGYRKAAELAAAQPSHEQSREPEEWGREAALCEEGAALKARGNELFSAKDFGGAACVSAPSQAEPAKRLADVCAVGAGKSTSRRSSCCRWWRRCTPTSPRRWRSSTAERGSSTWSPRASAASRSTRTS